MSRGAGGAAVPDARPSFGIARLSEETRERFVREIVIRVPLPRLVALHLFAPMRQGGVESGVAVVAAVLDAVDAVDVVDVSADGADDPPEAAVAGAPSAAPRRHTVFTARYRLVLKGPDRGRWSVDVREEADAPMVTVEAVVRGVHVRAGDAADSERLDVADVARLLGVPLPDAIDSSDDTSSTDAVRAAPP